MVWVYVGDSSDDSLDFFWNRWRGFIDARAYKVVGVHGCHDSFSSRAAPLTHLPVVAHPFDPRNALFRRLRLPHRFQALVSVQLLGLKNLSPHYHPSKTDVFAAVTLKRPDPAMGGGAGTRSVGNPSGGDLSVADPKRRGRETFITPVKRLLPTANGQAIQQSRWGVKAGFRFALPEEASPYVLAYGDRAYELVMGGYGPDGTDGGVWAKGTGAGIGVESQGPPRCVRITVWRKLFVTEQRLGEVEVPLNGLDDRGVVNEWVALRGDKGSAW